MKTRLDTPHLEQLRYDYKLLHDCYQQDDLAPMRGVVSGVLIGAGLWGVITCAVLWLLS
jgi:hypothetical protein